MKKQKVVHMTSVHNPFDGRIFHKECKSLVQAGFDVTLIAPNNRNEIVEEIKIKGVEKAKSRFQRIFRTTWQVFNRARREKADIYHFHDPELIPVGIMLKRLGNHVIYDNHEDLPLQIQQKTWIPAILRKVLKFVVMLAERIAGNSLDKVIVVDDNMGQNYPAQKTEIIANYPLLSEIQNEEAIPYQDRENNIIYTGSISKPRGIIETLLALEKLPKKLEFQFILAGDFAYPAMHEEVRQMKGWDFVDFRGRVSKTEVFKIMQNAKIGMSLFHPVPQYMEHVIGTKILEFMAFGIPTICPDYPKWRKFYEPLECVKFVNPLDVDEIAETICWLFENPEKAKELGKHGQEATRSKYNWNNEALKLVNLYKRILKSDQKEICVQN